MLDFFTRLEMLVEKMMKLVEFAAPIASAVAPQYAPISMAAGTIAAGVDKAITEHEAAGSTPQSAVASLAVIAQTVAASGVVDAATSAKINQVVFSLPENAFIGA